VALDDVEAVDRELVPAALGARLCAVLGRGEPDASSKEAGEDVVVRAELGDDAAGEGVGQRGAGSV